MSDLKAYYGDIYIPIYGSIADAQVYLKSEADKVIAEKDKELRHHKYKRCLAMARWCESEAYIHEHGSEYDEDLVIWFRKWHKRWLELAEKFKPNSTAR